MARSRSLPEPARTVLRATCQGRGCSSMGGCWGWHCPALAAVGRGPSPRGAASPASGAGVSLQRETHPENRGRTQPTASVPTQGLPNARAGARKAPGGERPGWLDPASQVWWASAPLDQWPCRAAQESRAWLSVTLEGATSVAP